MCFIPAIHPQSAPHATFEIGVVNADGYVHWLCSFIASFIVYILPDCTYTYGTIYVFTRCVTCNLNFFFFILQRAPKRRKFLGHRYFRRIWHISLVATKGQRAILAFAALCRWFSGDEHEILVWECAFFSQICLDGSLFLFLFFFYRCVWDQNASIGQAIFP